MWSRRWFVIYCVNILREINQGKTNSCRTDIDMAVPWCDLESLMHVSVSEIL